MPILIFQAYPCNALVLGINMQVGIENLSLYHHSMFDSLNMGGNCKIVQRCHSHCADLYGALMIFSSNKTWPVHSQRQPALNYQQFTPSLLEEANTNLKYSSYNTGLSQNSYWQFSNRSIFGQLENQFVCVGQLNPLLPALFGAYANAKIFWMSSRFISICSYVACRS